MSLRLKCGAWLFDAALPGEPEVPESPGDFSPDQVIEIGHYRHRNGGPSGQGPRQFFENSPGAYKEPLTVDQPDHGLPPPAGLKYVTRAGQPLEAPKERIAGIILKEEDGSVAIRQGTTDKKLRFSISNPQGPGVPVIRDDGSMEHDGRIWHLRGLHDKDRHRYRETLVAYLYPSPRADGSVIVDELEDVSY
ncbi:MAG: hypothetical protein DCC75_11850 [Proteobacteria bacterium]|nr:MAG: hypothetical protein DCC75_11850 [Pseudomonadota bacterium]